MQDVLDSRQREVKILCNFDIEKEASFYEGSVYDFYFHLSVKSDYNSGEKDR